VLPLRPLRLFPFIAGLMANWYKNVCMHHFGSKNQVNLQTFFTANTVLMLDWFQAGTI